MDKLHYTLIFVGGVILTVFLTIITGDTYTLNVPAAIPIGALALGLGSLIPLLSMYIRSRTTVVITNCGHFTIRPDDVKHISLDISKEKGSSLIVNLTIMLTGSLHMDNFWTGGGNANDPILVFPSTYERKIAKCYISEANLKPANINNELFYEVRNYLMKLDEGRVAAKTPLLFGLTSAIDGSCTAENLFLEEKMKAQERMIKILKDDSDAIGQQMKKRREIDEPIVLQAAGTVEK